jgi:D-alanyl-D-alanine carboxypeptidase/D-alanyl-D-alanine-endopeptidase (penicillin-binding protein 4)
MKVQRTIRQAACVLTMAAACFSAPAQTTTDAGAKPEAVASTQQPLAQQIAALLADPAVARAHWGIVVTTLDGKPIYALNEAQLFQPASNAKLFTTAAAMALLGPHQRFTTRIEYGSVGSKDKTIDGDIVIIGTGDGNLSNNDFPYHTPEETKNAPEAEIPPLHYLIEVADEITAAGVKRLKGDVIGDDTVFPWEPYPQGWSIDDTVWGYGAPVSGLSIEDNQIRVTVRPGRTAAERPTLEWQAGTPAYYRVDAGALFTGPAKSGNHVQMAREVGSQALRIYGSIAVDAPPDSEEIAIADPAEFTAIALKELLEERGVRVDGKALAKHRFVYQGPGFMEESRQDLPKLPAVPMSAGLSSILTGLVSCSDACPVMLQHTSPQVLDDVVLTNKISQNLHAELLLHHLGKTYGEAYAGGNGGVDGSTAEGVRVVRQFLINAGIDKDDFVFYDGSGLSGYDLVTPRATAKLLSFAAHDSKTGSPQPWFADWKASLPVGGVDGTLADRFTTAPLKGHVFAKTGTHSEGRALSGYLDCASGQTVIFSILVDHHLPGDNADRDAMDKIVATIAAAE